MFQVLIVDDDRATVEVIRDTLSWQEMGVSRVFEAYNIGQAKRLLQTERVDVVISDIEMPMGSGLDLLAWFREQKLAGEFLLLTCHENFGYASSALHHQAAEYLLKPFDAGVMELTLRRILARLTEQRRLAEDSASGAWVKENLRQLRRSFWHAVLEGQYDGDAEKVRRTLRESSFGIDADGEYCLVVSRITNLERDREHLGQNLIRFAVENIHSEVLCGHPENSDVVCREDKTGLSVVTVCEKLPEDVLEKRCAALLRAHEGVLSSVLTCCLCAPCAISAMYAVSRRAMQCIAENVAYYGGFFRERDARPGAPDETAILDLKTMDELLNAQNKKQFLGYLKTKLEERLGDRSLSEQLLESVRQEALQAIYAYLARSEIQASRLFAGELSQELTQKASQSIVDLIRWASYTLTATFDCAAEVQKSNTLVGKVNQYLQQHYDEELSRSQIAGVFFLSPEYLGKVYKKQTGQNMKDYLTAYRIEKAKELLRTSEQRVGDVALAVGFDNFTYFSTMFKKLTGQTPNEYRRQRAPGTETE